MSEREITTLSWVKLILASLSFGSFPFLLFLGLKSVFKTIPYPPWHFVLVCLASAGIWFMIRTIQKFTSRLSFRILALVIWVVAVSLVCFIYASCLRRTNVRFFASFEQHSAKISRADFVHLVKLRLMLGSVTRPCIAIFPNHNISSSHQIPEQSFLVYGLGVDRPKELSDKYTLQVMIRNAKGQIRNIEDVSFTESSVVWNDHILDLSSYAGQKVDIIFQVRGLREERISSAEPPMIFLNNPRIIRADPSRPNIILIVIDTLRADYVSYDPAKPGLTPRLAELAVRGSAFTRHYSQSSMTLPSTASLLTSTLPVQTGITSSQNKNLRSENETIAEVISRAGWRTAAFSGNVWINTIFGFDQGFDHFESAHSLPIYCWRAGGLLTEKAVSWVRENRTLPFFLYVHYIDPHDPYFPPNEHIRLRGKESIPLLDFIKTAFWWGPVKLPDFIPDPRPFELNDTYKALYAGEVKYIDHCLGRFFDELDQLGILENTIIIITSDHGEEFRDHGLLVHGTSLYEELILVPLIIYDGREKETGARTINAITTNLDIMPTILDYAGVPPSEILQGRSLRSLIQEPEHTSRQESAFAELYAVARFHYSQAGYREGLENAYLRTMIKGKTKLIKALDLNTGGVTMEIYDLENDPAEKNNLADVEPEKFEDEREELESFFNNLPGALPPAEAVKIPKEMVELLKSLGYLQ